MIRKIPYSEIDFDKYSKCLSDSVQYRYSATKVFLDITSNKQWELLVYKDYEAVMPISYMRKLGFKIVVNPKLCQQLGIFSKKDDIQVNDLLLNYFEKNYKVLYYAFNDVNTFSKELLQRKNYLITAENYDDVFQKYSPKRRRKLRLDEEISKNSKIEEVKFNNVANFVNLNFVGAINDEDKQGFFRIFQDFEQKNYLKIFAFYLKENIINLIILYVENNTVVLLGSFNDKYFVKIGGSSVLIDHVIYKYINHKSFDFEGSEIPAIEEFFRGFRPKLKPYKVIRNSKRGLIKGIFSFKTQI